MHTYNLGSKQGRAHKGYTHTQYGLETNQGTQRLNTHTDTQSHKIFFLVNVYKKNSKEDQKKIIYQKKLKEDWKKITALLKGFPHACVLV